MEIAYTDRGMIIHTDGDSALVISDLHLGYEEELAEEKGVHFPLQHSDILKRITTLVTKYSVSNLYIIGDIKHTIFTDAPYNWDILPEFMTNLSEIVHTTVIPGNHDGEIESLLPRSIVVEDVYGIVIGERKNKIGLLHGHTWPSPSLLDASLIVTGHSHPSVSRFRTVSKPELGRSDRRRFTGSVPVVLKSNLRKNCVRRQLGLLELSNDDNAILVTLPSFNQLISGLAINSPQSKMQGPFFENSCTDFLASEVFSTDGLFLGTIEWMRKQFNEMIKSKPSGDRL